MDQRLDLPLLRLRALEVFPSLEVLRGRSHEVLVGGKVCKGYSAVFNGVLIQLAVNCFQQVSANVLHD